MNPKISVIVPAFNCEKTIEKCVNSIINQTFSDWELIIIDDGSTDDTFRIINSFNDSRIRIIKQNNSGPGIARNKGIAAACGVYCVFIDSDDYISNDYFLLLSKRFGNDLIYIDVEQVDDQGKHIKNQKISRFKHESHELILKKMMTGKIPWGGVRKVVKRELLINNQIFYANYSIGEEALFSVKCSLYARKIDFIDEKNVYFYVIHNNSQSTKLLENPWLPVFNSYEEFFEKNELISSYGSALKTFNVSCLLTSLNRLVKMYTGNELNCKADEQYQIFKNNKKKYKAYHIQINLLDFRFVFLLCFINKLGIRFLLFILKLLIRR